MDVTMAEAVVQRMVPGGVETIVTVESHPAFGPVVGFGLGGVIAPFPGIKLIDLAIVALHLV
jgi:high-affinity K+ transport system ATPase subunit B